MININEVVETNKMIEKENFDVRTITMGISLMDCVSDDLSTLCNNIYNKITRLAKDLVSRADIKGIGCAHCKQAYCHHTYCSCGR